MEAEARLFVRWMELIMSVDIEAIDKYVEATNVSPNERSVFWLRLLQCETSYNEILACFLIILV